MNRRSKTLFARAQRYIPGGVNSPVRAFRSVGGDPLFIKSGRGSRMFDEDGASYIDYIGSWGPLILGHSAAPVRLALKRQIASGTSWGADGTRSPAGRDDLRGGTVDREDPARELRYGSDDERHPAARAFTGRTRSSSSTAAITAMRTPFS